MTPFELRTPTDTRFVHELHFRAMGTDAHVIVVGPTPDHHDTIDLVDPFLAELADAARRRIDQLERRWSRFLPDSEVSTLTRRAGQPVTVSDDTVLLVRLAVEAFGLSGGSFDPTVLGDLLRAGYDRSFDDLASGPRDRDPNDTQLRPTGLRSILTTGCAGIEIHGRSVCLPAGTGVDPGGIGKGLAADLVTDELLAAGAEGAGVNLGGDLRVRGFGPEGSWTVEVVHPHCRHPIAMIGLRDGAVATSTTLRRTWERGGEHRHHLIDPGTGLPSGSDLELVTCVASNAWVAEIDAKAILLRGSEHPFDLIGGSGAEALAVDRTGRIQTTEGLGRFLGPVPLPDSIHEPISEPITEPIRVPRSFR